MKEKNKEKVIMILEIFILLCFSFIAGLCSNVGIGILVYVIFLAGLSIEQVLEKILVQLKINNVLQIRLLKKKVRGKK